MPPDPPPSPTPTPTPTPTPKKPPPFSPDYGSTTTGEPLDTEKAG